MGIIRQVVTRIGEIAPFAWKQEGGVPGREAESRAESPGVARCFHIVHGRVREGEEGGGKLGERTRTSRGSGNRDGDLDFER